eukprot:10910978-Ditylum_brightwellii.AAC.1
MSRMQNLCKHFKTADADVGSGFDPFAIPFIPKTSTLKVKNSQEFNLCIFATKKDNTYKFKAHTFLNGSPNDILEWEKKMQKIIRCKLVDILEGDALTHWLKFKWVEVAMMSKNPNGLNTVPLEICNPTFAIYLQDLKKHYFSKNASRLQKSYLLNHIKKPNKLTIKNNAARLHNLNSMLAKFPVLGNTPITDDDLCNILYQMIELLKVIKQKSEAIVVDGNNDEQKKSSSHCTNSAKSKCKGQTTW